MKEDPNISKNIRLNIDHFNKICAWVATTIVLGNDKKTRAYIIENFILVATIFKELRNFNGLLEIMTGLTCLAIQRLNQSWKMLSEGVAKNYQQLQAIIALTNNSTKLRKLISRKNNKPCIPYIGIYLNDLVKIDDGNPNVLENKKWNVSKFSMIARIVNEVKSFQKLDYELIPLEVIQQFLADLPCLSEDEQYDESLLREPRKL